MPSSVSFSSYFAGERGPSVRLSSVAYIVSRWTADDKKGSERGFIPFPFPGRGKSIKRLSEGFFSFVEWLNSQGPRVRSQKRGEHSQKSKKERGKRNWTVGKGIGKRNDDAAAISLLLFSNPHPPFHSCSFFLPRRPLLGRPPLQGRGRRCWNSLCYPKIFPCKNKILK